MKDSAVGVPPWLLQLGLPAVAGSIAVVFSHPLELTKIRLQLDNELAQRGTARQYSGWLNCVAQTWQREGIRGLQRGLSLGITREFFFNGLRIGCFEPLVQVLHQWSGREGPPGGDIKLAAGLGAGALGGCMINPLDVCKTRAQALGGATGHQHAASSRGPIAVLAALTRDEGVRGLVRGVGTNTIRGILGPGSQLVAYTDFKERASKAGFSASAVSTHVVCSLASAAVSVGVVNPTDVARTRLFNQPFDATGRGLWYKNGWHALGKVVSVEGPAALYKGAGANFLRLGPHMILVFVTLEQLKQRFVP